MSRHSSYDTIAAIATARGLGGIGIIRVSGSRAREILGGLFRRGGKALASFTARRMEHGWILARDGKILDEALVVFMPGPGTFSGEDVAEIHCHGGRAVLDAALESVFSRGARPAEAGEFTRRAFLNGRLDLSRAEAVAEIIAAPTLQGVYLARNKLAGKLGLALEDLRARLDFLRARLYVEIDFPDEAAEENDGADLAFRSKLDEIRLGLQELVTAYDLARLWREGALVVLAGRVNVGKSSLLNALLGRKRALVSDTPGTTRDFIEETLNLRDLPVRLADTAGLRGSCDPVEAEGMTMSRELFRQADIVLLVLDASCAGPEGFPVLQAEEKELLEQYGENGNGRVFIVLNKIDLSPLQVGPEKIFGSRYGAVSAKTGAGLEDMLENIYNMLLLRADGLDFEQAAPPTLRQKFKLEEALRELDALVLEFQNRIPAELMSIRLDSVAVKLDEVIGVSSSEEVLNQVFAGFCIGK